MSLAAQADPRAETMVEPQRPRKTTWRGWVLQCLGAVGWGYFIVTSPQLEVLTSAFIIWFPILVLCEWRRSKRYGFLPGALARIGIVAVIVMAASLAPLKYMDGYAGPFSGEPTTLIALKAQMREQEIFLHYPRQYSEEMPNYDNVSVTLPAKRMGLRELAPLIEQQTGLTLRMGYCGNGASILRGMYPMSGFNFEAPLANSNPAP